MAEIIPFRAWRYHHQYQSEISNLVSPLFDVVSEKQRARLYQHPYNSIHLSVPEEPEPATRARKTLENWKQNQVIVRDDKPGIYVYYQYFRLPGNPNTFCRKGFICNIRVYDWDEEVILRHENTMPHSVNDRIAILDQTQLNVSPTHGLYHDPEFAIEKYLDQSMETPLSETEDYQGVKDVLSVITDPEIIAKIVGSLANKQVILADGHHRYEGSLAYRNKRRNENPAHTGKEGYNYHMMYLTNMEANDIRILPTHRLVEGLPDFDSDALIKKLKAFFMVSPVENAYDINEVIMGKTHAFGLLLKDQAYRLQLKEGFEKQIPWHFPDQIKQLDLTILHYYIFEKGLGIPGKSQRMAKNITFDRNFADCLIKVTTGQVQIAVIVNELTIDEIKEVCFSGYTLPQKSTYFYPKVICGFLFDSIADHEF